jgi:hypothetical protein
MTEFSEETKAILKMIEDDAEADAMALDGAPFNGKQVGANFGKIFAAIQALARIMRTGS